MNAITPMTRRLVVVPPELSLRSAWVIMERGNMRHLLVARAGVLIGILSDRDVLLRASLAGSGDIEVPETLVGVAMTACPITCEPSTPVSELVQQMTDCQIDAIPVVKNGRLVGLVTSTDLLLLLGHGPLVLAEPLPWEFQMDEFAA